jgi:ABC-type amino acid transport substrate-binding protein
MKTHPLTRRQWLGAAALAVASPAALADLADLRQKGSLKVAFYKNHLPFSDSNAQGSLGADVDLAQALATKLQLGVQWLPFEAGETMGDDLRNMVWRGHYLGYGPADVMMQVPIDRYLIEKTPQVEFLRPYYRHRLVWLSKGTPDASALRNQALDGISLAAEVGTAAGTALLSLDGGRFKAQTHTLPTGLEAAQGVVSGRWQAAYVTQAQAELAIKGLDRSSFVLEPAVLRGTPVNGWAVGMAIKSKQPQLASALGAALKDLHDDGSLARIWNKHGLTLLAP